MTTKLVSIIIPTYNREKEILECIGSLSKVTYPSFEIIVIDNASKDDTTINIKKNFPFVKIIELSENFGASRARNEGIKYAKGEYLCFVDDDNIVDNNFLTELILLAESDELIGFCGPKIYYLNDPRRIWYAGADINLLTSRTKYIGTNKIDKYQYDSLREVGHIPDVWLVKRTVVDKIGLIDINYHTYYEESDWAMRAKKAGYKIMFCPTSIVYHNIPTYKEKSLRSFIGFDSSYRVFYAARNRIIYMKKYATKPKFILFLIVFNNIFLIAYCLIFLFYGRFDLIKSYTKGFLSGIKN
ncbi:MAG: glycosyltransferase family 2 protein [bacterium]